MHVDLVDEYSFAEAHLYNSSQDSFVINDYLHFCYARSARSFEAVALLAKQNFREDVFVVLRSIYENYLSFWYVFENPDTLDAFVKAKILRSSRRFEHPNSGPSRHLRIIDPNTGVQMLYGRSMSELARHGSQRITKKFHDLMFEYLCEFTHNHFMAFGGYVEPENYAKITARRTQKDLESLMYALLFSSLWLESFPEFEDVDYRDMRRIRHQIKTSRSLLLEVGDKLRAEGKYEALLREVKLVTGVLGSKFV
ncbi:MAG: hypothetical protein KME14_19195 [Tildeniella torsiva UHER 1998/13D]|nr:hypothetical protein [Tildeniella torsiva UHER 1998/13D]